MYSAISFEKKKTNLTKTLLEESWMAVFRLIVSLKDGEFCINIKEIEKIILKL